MNERNPLNLIDSALIQFDKALRAVVPGTSQALRSSPALSSEEPELSASEKKHIAGLMRINHCGEVCAQALYNGQAATAKLPEVRQAMEHAASEEVDHLSWCEDRLNDLDSRPSLFNPLWYGLSYGLGAAAGLAGDKWSLGFVAETEQQVCEHLQDHLSRLPAQDEKSKAILEQMLVDEKKHGDSAIDAGAAALPQPIKLVMGAMAKIMKTTSYRF